VQFDKTHRVMYDGLYTFAVRLFNVALAAGLAIVTARTLGPGGRGLYSLPGIEAALVSSIFGGLGSTASYFLLNRNPDRSFLKVALGCAALWIAVAAVALVPLALFSSHWTLLPALAVLPAMASLNLASGYSLGIRKVRYSSVIVASQNLLTICAVAFAIFLVGANAHIAIAGWIVGTTLAGAIALGYVLLDARARTAGDGHVGFAEFTKFCMKASSVYVVTLLNYRADMYVVALMLSPAALGMYGIAVTVAETLLLPTQAAAFVASPHIATLEPSESALLTSRCVRNNLLIAAAMCALLFVFAQPILGLLYGKAFLPAVPAFDVLLIGVLALSIGSPVSTYFTLRAGRPQIAMWLGSLSAAVCLATSIALIQHYGMVGAAIGSTAGYVAGQFAGLWYFARRAHVSARTMLIPTATDLHAYASFAARIAEDGRRLFQAAP